MTQVLKTPLISAYISTISKNCDWAVFSTEADKGQSQNIYEIRKNIFKIGKKNLNRNVF